jgi:hypothetical protein
MQVMKFGGSTKGLRLSESSSSTQCWTSRLPRRGQCLETWGEIRLRACYLDEVLYGEDFLRLASMPANSPRTSLR